jgi:hypothetical protein
MRAEVACRPVRHQLEEGVFSVKQRLPIVPSRSEFVLALLDITPIGQSASHQIGATRTGLQSAPESLAARGFMEQARPASRVSPPISGN